MNTGRAIPLREMTSFLIPTLSPLIGAFFLVASNHVNAFFPDIYLYFQEFPSLDCSGAVHRVRGVRSGVCQADLRFAAELLHEQFVDSDVGVLSYRASVSAERASEWAIDLFGAQACEDESRISSHNLSFVKVPPVRLNASQPAPCDVSDVSRGKSLKLHWEYFVPPNLINGADHLIETGYVNPPPDSTCADEMIMKTVDFFSASRADTCLDRYLPVRKGEALSYSFVCSKEHLPMETHYATSDCQQPLAGVNLDDQECVLSTYNMSQIHRYPYLNAYSYTYSEDSDSRNSTDYYYSTYTDEYPYNGDYNVSTLSHFMCDTAFSSGENTWSPIIPALPISNITDDLMPPHLKNSSHNGTDTDAVSPNTLLLWEMRLSLGGLRWPNGSLLLQDEQLYVSLSELVCDALSLPRENCSCAQQNVVIEPLASSVFPFSQDSQIRLPEANSLKISTSTKIHDPSQIPTQKVEKEEKLSTPSLRASYTLQLSRLSPHTQHEPLAESTSAFALLFATVNVTMHATHVFVNTSSKATSKTTSNVSVLELQEELLRRLETGLSAQAQPWSRFVAETVAPHPQYWDEANTNVQSIRGTLLSHPPQNLMSPLFPTYMPVSIPSQKPSDGEENKLSRGEFLGIAIGLSLCMCLVTLLGWAMCLKAYCGTNDSEEEGDTCLHVASCLQSKFCPKWDADTSSAAVAPE